MLNNCVSSTNSDFDLHHGIQSHAQCQERQQGPDFHGRQKKGVIGEANDEAGGFP